MNSGFFVCCGCLFLQLGVAFGQEALVVDDGAGVGALTDGTLFIPGLQPFSETEMISASTKTFMPTGVGAV